MHILAMGLNHRTASVALREQMVFPDASLGLALSQLKETKSVLECVIVSTCNRMEIYVLVDRLDRGRHFVRSFLQQWFNIPRLSFANKLYIHEDLDAVHHLFRVITGLDSLVLGESQVLGQVRDSFLIAQRQKATGTIFNTLFKQAVTLGKRAFTETTINENAVSVSYAAVELGRQIFGTFADKKVLIIGAGETGELTVKHLHSLGIRDVVVVNRTMDRAHQLADRFHGRAYSWDCIPALLLEIDVVITSTAASQWVIYHEMLTKLMDKRRQRPLFLMDIAVPRNIDPSVGELSNVFLYDMDDLHQHVDSNLQQRQVEARKIEQIIDDQIIAFEEWLCTLGVRPVIQALQDKTNAIHQDTMESLINRLGELDQRQIKVLRKLTKSMLNQVLRDPILRMKEMATEPHGEQALLHSVRLLGLEGHLAEETTQWPVHMKRTKGWTFLKRSNPIEESIQSPAAIFMGGVQP